MPSPSIAELLSNERLTSLDAEHVAIFNRRAAEKFRLHPELGPSAYEGNIDQARVVLLLANPGFDGTSTTGDHTFRQQGWSLAGLHPDAPSGLRQWWHSRVGALAEAFGAQRVSNSVACLQITPWASTKFNASLRLPSRASLLEAANRCAQREAVMLVLRAEKHWLTAAALKESPLRFRVRSWRCSYVSPGNLSEHAWSAVFAAVGHG